ncbi:hypothetical protein [Pseudorhodoferax sp. Leaf267]|uniref:hypothetical protein n=1 Tax=Pseudorhodoferax sp. Leaf267 TaxID=1736316 RepID=UPI0012E1409F|nr:hypothetical protein [Pseudorhodoferax sp. Leaf267]
MSAALFTLPTSQAAPVKQSLRRGCLPEGVSSIWQGRVLRQRQAQHEANRQRYTADAIAFAAGYNQADADLRARRAGRLPQGGAA